MLTIQEIKNAMAGHQPRKLYSGDRRRGPAGRALGFGKRLIRRGIRSLPLIPYLSRAHRHGHIAMIHIGRSGSTVVGDLLNQHPMITWDGEIYQEIFRARQFPDGRLPPITDVDAVGHLIKRSSYRFARYYGFETKFFHLRALGSELAGYLDALDQRLRNLSYVVLERKNTLRKVVSALLAQKTARWHHKPDVDLLRNRVYIDVDSVFVNRTHRPLRHLLEEAAGDFELIERLMQNRHALHLTYENDVQADPLRAYEKICEHVGLTALPATVHYARTNAHPLEELIENYEDVASHLRGTGFAWMLEEG